MEDRSTLGNALEDDEVENRTGDGDLRKEIDSLQSADQQAGGCCRQSGNDCLVGVMDFQFSPACAGFCSGHFHAGESRGVAIFRCCWVAYRALKMNRVRDDTK
ncbi:hypothetical protein D3C85_1718240 [compost metagenome]